MIKFIFVMTSLTYSLSWAGNTRCEKEATDAYPLIAANRYDTKVIEETPTTIAYDVDAWLDTDEGSGAAANWQVRLRKSDCSVIKECLGETCMPE